MDSESSMNSADALVVFSLDEQKYALHLSRVEKIVGAVEITPLPKAPEIVLGVFNEVDPILRTG